LIQPAGSLEVQVAAFYEFSKLGLKSKKPELLFSIISALMISFFQKESITHLLFIGKEFGSRSLINQILLVGAYTFLISTAIFVIIILIEHLNNIANINDFFIKTDKRFSISKKGAATILLGIFIFGVAITYYFVTLTAYGPVHQLDENRYWKMAYELYKGTFTLNANFHYPMFYPISILPAFLWQYPNGTYLIAKLMNVIYFTSVVFPSYLIIRKFVSRGLSLFICMIILLNPNQIVFTRSILSENVFYPIFMWTLYFAFSNFTSPKHKLRFIENLIFGILLAILLLTRFIALPVIPALLVIWWFKPYQGEKPLFFLSTKKIIQFLVVLAPFMLIIFIWIYAGNREGLSIKQVLGFSIASNPDPLQLSWSRLFLWTNLYLSYSALLAGPFIGVLIISILNIPWKSWQDDLPRWTIGVGLIFICILLACIRHSWRAEYNYPDPIKIQGRYLFMLGPLFLITAVASIKREKIQNFHLSDLNFLFFSIVSICILIIAYKFLIEGYLFLGKPIKISVSSSDGYLIQLLRYDFLIICSLCILVTILFISRNQRLLMATFLTLLCFFFLIGDIRIYYENLLPRQKDNIEAYYLLEALKKDNNGLIKPDTSQITIKVRPGLGESYENWRNAFRFYGYQNLKIETDLSLNEFPISTDYKVDIAGVSSKEYKIDQVDKDNYLNCDCVKYSYMNNYFIVE
jgi:hypothetical protein